MVVWVINRSQRTLFGSGRFLNVLTRVDLITVYLYTSFILLTKFDELNPHLIIYRCCLRGSLKVPTKNLER